MRDKTRKTDEDAKVIELNLEAPDHTRERPKGIILQLQILKSKNAPFSMVNLGPVFIDAGKAGEEVKILKDNTREAAEFIKAVEATGAKSIGRSDHTLDFMLWDETPEHFLRGLFPRLVQAGLISNKAVERIRYPDPNTVEESNPLRDLANTIKQLTEPKFVALAHDAYNLTFAQLGHAAAQARVVTAQADIRKAAEVGDTDAFDTARLRQMRAAKGLGPAERKVESAQAAFEATARKPKKDFTTKAKERREASGAEHDHD